MVPVERELHHLDARRAPSPVRRIPSLAHLPLPTHIRVQVLPPVPPPRTPDDVDAFDRRLRAQMQHTLDALMEQRRQEGPWPLRRRDAPCGADRPRPVDARATG